jgi:hypothetical protein
MILRQVLHDRQSNSRYHTYPQVDFKKNSMGGVRKRLVAQDEMTFSRCMRMLPVRCALAKRYFRTQVVVKKGMLW